ncbi:ATP-binding protein [Mycobacterium paragordonae]|uniref:Nuclease SbcCD subunit C n=1 Tax=Mycobacterium paragordonae TaxID=1389713 RepID=A0AAJ1S8X4_9MYCO|nr:AAA family ATPase [Mycobacterium paragordonae]MDP7739483.1 AAA family ATPase [Mycobacterium paragordonae]PJE21519.1 MAG: AAA family ATPase [Mycobacterium sp.]
MTISYIEVCGFRSYGVEPQRVELSAPLTVIHADNSQGKTSLAEAFEFLHTGTISRRQLAGGSPGEFEGALRNAHIGPVAEVYVEVGLLDANGTEAIIRRELNVDYRGATDCESTLTVNGVTTESVTGVGLHLSDPPLAAPVLLEHALRYAVSAKPGDRSDYFKAMLEVADLDLVRTEIASLVTEREARPRESLVQKLDSLASVPALSPMLTTSQVASEHQLANSMLTMLNTIVPPGSDDVPDEQPLVTAIDRVQRELASRQNSVVPVRQLRPSPNPQPGIRIDVVTSEEHELVRPDNVALTARLSDHNTLAGTVERSVADVLPLLTAALSVTVVVQHDGDGPIDCPLCQTPDALTAERIAAIRRQVADQEGLTQSGSSLRTAVLSLGADLKTIRDWSAQATPTAASWADEQRSAYSGTILQLGGSTEFFDIAVAAGISLKTAADDLNDAIEAAQPLLARIVDRLEQLLDVPDADITELIQRDGVIRQSLKKHASALEKSLAASDTCIEDVEPKLSALSATDGWMVLIELSSNTELVWQAIVRQRNADACTTRLKAAQRVIVSEIKKVLDRKLELMADEIRTWWSLMRPNELTVFDRISRRGSGNRYLDLTASLVPEPAGNGVIRNALAVLSNSQVNALGLAAFLARCQLLDCPVIFLDDPVPGSDREHRYTFAGAVVAKLLEHGRQVIVATHDAELARTLQTLHQHLGINEFSANLLDPRVGTRIVRTGDDFERLMLDASSQMSSPLTENRRAAGNSLRIATERLAKHILVAARVAAGEPDASLADYDNKNLRDLRPMVTGHAKAPNEPGQWTTLARILNDSDHDTSPPQPADLKICYDMLRDIKRRHKVSTPAAAQ